MGNECAWRLGMDRAGRDGRGSTIGLRAAEGPAERVSYKTGFHSRPGGDGGMDWAFRCGPAVPGGQRRKKACVGRIVPLFCPILQHG